jgi:hypothetical protein
MMQNVSDIMSHDKDILSEILLNNLLNKQKYIKPHKCLLYVQQEHQSLCRLVHPVWTHHI